MAILKKYYLLPWFVSPRTGMVIPFSLQIQSCDTPESRFVGTRTGAITLTGIGLGLFLLLSLFSCTNPNYTPPENALDAGRQFADAVYKGNFKRANDLIVPGEQNKNLLTQKLEEPYHNLTSTDRNILSQASLQILEVDNQAKDSSTFIHFMNAYNNRPTTLKVIKSNGGWRVDLTYTYSGNP